MIIGVTAYGFGVLPIAFAIRSTMAEILEFKKVYIYIYINK